jgi:hypothetical protein
MAVYLCCHAIGVTSQSHKSYGIVQTIYGLAEPNRHVSGAGVVSLSALTAANRHPQHTTVTLYDPIC